MAKVFLPVALLALTALAAGQPQSDTLQIGPTQTNRATYQSSLMFDMARRGSFEWAIILGYAYQMHKSNHNQQPEDTIRFINQVEELYQRKHAEAGSGYKVPKEPLEVMYSIGDIVSELYPESKPFAEVSKNLLKTGTIIYEASVHDSSRVDANQFVSANEQLGYEFANRYIGSAWDLAQTDQNWRSVMDGRIANQFGITSQDTSSQIMSKKPEFKNATQMDQLVQGQQVLTTSVHDLEKELQKRTDRLLKGVAYNRLQLEQLSRGQQSIIRYLQAKEQREQQLADQQLQIDGARAAVFLLSTFARLGGNANAARQINAVGTAAIQIAQAFNQYEKSSTSTAKNVQNAEAMSAVVFTANILGAVLLIASMNSEEPDVDQVMMQQLRAISLQITQLSIDMHARFDRVEQNVNNSFKALNDNLALIFSLQRQMLQESTRARRDLDDIKLRLSGIQISLGEIQIENIEYLKSGFDRDFKRLLSSCLRHREYFTKDRISRAKFEDCEMEFSVHATEVSKDVLSVGLPTVADDSVLLQLRERPITSNLNLLAAVGAYKYGSSKLAGLVGNVANVSEWSSGVEAYLAMADANPDLAGELANEPIDRMLAVGNSLQQEINSLRDRRLIHAIIADYASKVDALRRMLEPLESDYRKQYVAGYDLWGGTKQKVEHPPRELQSTEMESCSERRNDDGWMSPNAVISMPESVKTLIPTYLSIAEDLQLGSLRVCYTIRDFTEANSKTRDARFEFGNYKELAVALRLRPAVRVQVFYTDKVHGTSSRIYDRIVETNDEIEWAWKRPNGQFDAPNYYTTKPGRMLQAGPDTLANWEKGWSLKSKFDTGFKAEPSAGLDKKGFQKVEDSVRVKLEEAGRDFYRRIGDGSIDRSSLEHAGTAIDSSRSFLEAITGISFGEQFSRNDAIRSLFYGRQRLLSSQEIRAVYLDATDPKLLQQRREWDKLEAIGVGSDCRALQREVAIADKAILPLLVSSGAYNGLSVPDRDALESRLRSLAKTDKASAKAVATMKRKTVGNSGPVDSLYVDDLLVKQLGLREQALAQLVDGYLTTPPSTDSFVQIPLSRLRIFKRIKSLSAKGDIQP